MFGGKILLRNLFSMLVTLLFLATMNTLVKGQEWEQSTEMKVSTSERLLPTALSLDSLGDAITIGQIGANSYIIKYNGLDGNILWQNILTGRTVCNLVIDSMNNFFVISYSTIAANTYSFTAKYKGTDGSLIWENSFIGDTPALTKDTQGNPVVSARSGNNYHTVKYNNAEGTVLWEANLLGANSASSPSVLADPLGNIIVAGLTGQSSTSYSYVTIKYNGIDGTVVWQKSKFSNRWFVPLQQSLACDRSGNVILISVPDISTNYLITKYSGADGSLLWENSSLHNSNRNPKIVLTDSSNDVIVADTPLYSNPSAYRYHLVKYGAADGNTIWNKSFEKEGTATGMVLDSQNSIILTGDAGYTVKYQSTDGNIIWRKCFLNVFYSSAGSPNIVQIKGIALDSSDNVIVTGNDNIAVFHGNDLYDAIMIKKYINLAPKPPNVISGSITDISSTSSHTHATLNGVLTPNGDITDYWIEIGTDTSYSYYKTAAKPVGDGWSAIQINDSFTVGQFNTTYHVRLVASNIMGTIYGEDQTFNSGPPADACLEFPTQEQIDACHEMGSLFSDSGGAGGDASSLQLHSALQWLRSWNH